MDDDVRVFDRKKFRKRVRKYSTDEFVEQQSAELAALELAKRTDSGIYCKDCRRRKRWPALDIAWDFFIVQDKYVFIRSWVCKDCGAFLQEDEISVDA